MRIAPFERLLLIVALTAITGCGPSASLPVAERQQTIQEMEAETLKRLYREHAATADKIKNAAGYGVFAHSSVNLFFATGGGGYGCVTDNATGQRIYMKMAQGGVALGLGIKDLRIVFIFKSKDVLNKFIYSGWEFGAQADASAKAGVSGADVSTEGSIHDDIEVYSMTESGLALQATIAGTKFWKDDSLN